jgi:hypothetical protein
MDAYRRQFRLSERFVAQQGSIGVFAICAETEPEARRLAVSRDLMRLRRDLK